MQPRRDADYHRLKEPHKRVCFKAGMPKQFLLHTPSPPQFTPFKTTKGMMGAPEQKSFYDNLSTEIETARTIVWASWPTDALSLAAASRAILDASKRGLLKEFEFMGLHEDIPRRDPKQLYCVMGVHEDDPEAIRKARRWMRFSPGSSVWIIATTQDPLAFCQNKIGIVPDALFYVKRSGISVG